MAESSHRPAPTPVEHRSSTLRLVVSWGLVSIPLAWGVYQTLVKSMALFR